MQSHPNPRVAVAIEVVVLGIGLALAIAGGVFWAMLANSPFNDTCIFSEDPTPYPCNRQVLNAFFVLSVGITMALVAGVFLKGDRGKLKQASIP